MINRYFRIGFSGAVLCLYSLILYFILTSQQKLDFFAFYSSSIALLHGENPYELTDNLNPPMVLWLFSPLAHLGFWPSLFIWIFIVFASGLIASHIAFRYVFSIRFLKKNSFNLYLLYLAYFASIMNAATLQLGTFLFLFVMLGYNFYLKNRSYFAGFFWGFIIGMKFFPGLLFFYVLRQKRFKVFWVMLITFIIVLLIPLLVYGIEIYKDYYSMVIKVDKFGNGWNASIYGFLVRLLPCIHIPYYSLLIKILSIFLFIILFLWYLKNLESEEINPINHQPFCLTLVMMLLISPLGWIYYFTLLIFPLMLIGVALNQKETATILIWVLCFFLINFPLDYIPIKTVNYFARMTIFSCYFYGLLILIFLLQKRKKIYGNKEIYLEESIDSLTPAIISILSFSLFVPTLFFIMRLF